MKLSSRITVLCAALVLTAPVSHAQTRETRMAELSIAYSAVTRIAEILGFLKAEHAPIIIVPVQAGPDAVGQLRSPTGSQLATIAVTPVVTLIGAGEHPIVLATTLTSDQQVQLVTFAGNGITDDPKSLRGKKIGRVRNTVGEIYLSRLLEKGGLKASDVELVHGLPADLVNLLVRGELDAAALWDPFPSQVKRRYTDQTGKGQVKDRGEMRVFIDKSLYTLAFNIVTTKQKLVGNEEAVKGLLRALIKVEHHFKTAPHDAQIKLEGWLGLPMGDLDHFMRTTSFRVELDTGRMKQWLGEEMTWLKSVQEVKVSPVDMSPFVDSSLLQAVAPDRVK